MLLLTSQPETRTLLQAPVTQAALRPRASDKDLAVDESSNFLCISYFAHIR